MNMFNIISGIIFNIDFLLQTIMVIMIPTDLARMSPVPGVLREDRMIANGKMAIILPTGQWYAPSAVINDAWYCMV